VLRQQARETDLENLLEYYNKDVELAHSRLASAFLHWVHVAAEVCVGTRVCVHLPPRKRTNMFSCVGGVAGGGGEPGGGESQHSLSAVRYARRRVRLVHTYIQ
jgi:hypothetical protein